MTNTRSRPSNLKQIDDVMRSATSNVVRAALVAFQLRRSPATQTHQIERLSLGVLRPSCAISSREETEKCVVEFSRVAHVATMRGAVYDQGWRRHQGQVAPEILCAERGHALQSALPSDW